MPGWSLWLVPPKDSVVDTILTRLIGRTIPDVLPQLGNLPNFAPHLTLTSGNSPDDVQNEAQQWLDQLDIDTTSGVHVRFHSIVSEDTFFKRLIIRCEKDPGLVSLAKHCRMHAVEGGDNEKAEEWAKSYDPHSSLA